MGAVGALWMCWVGPTSPLELNSAQLKPCSAFFTSKFQPLHHRSLLAGNPRRKSTGFCHVSSSVNAGEVIKRHVDDGDWVEAVEVYVEMFDLGLIAAEEFRFFPIVIKAFGGSRDVRKAKEIHGHVAKLGVLDDVYCANAVLGVYWRVGEVEDAARMFETMSERDLVSWNTMVSGFCGVGEFVRCLEVFRRMVREFGVLPNRVACLSGLSSCGSEKELARGREVHGFVVKRWLDGDEFVVSGLVDMYMKCGDVRNAECVYRRVVEGDDEGLRGNAVIWNVMISGYVLNGCWAQAVELFVEMLESGVSPDSSTLVSVTGLCSQLLDLAFGKQVHKFCLSMKLNTDVRVETALMDMYFKCGDSTSGLGIFRRSLNRNMVMWSAAISNFAQSSHPREALKLFHEYVLDYGFLDSVIVLAVLRASSSLADKSIGMEVHGLAVKLGFDSDVYVASAIVDFYAKCRDVDSAQEVFYRLPARDLVSWNALISGYAQSEYLDEALKAFLDMQHEGIRPNAVSVASILSVCAQLSVIMLCKEVHGYLLRHEFGSNVLVSNSLITTYAKCGDINSSRNVFETMHQRSEVSWNSILLGLGMHGHADEAFSLFEKMVAAGLQPDHATFTALLSACSHAGRVEEGLKYFQHMVKFYKIEPRLEQYTCMVDLLGRAGQLKHAYDIILTMPCASDDRIWGSLLGSCRIHGDERLAEVVADHIFKLNPTNIGYRTLLANLYEEYGKWNDVARVRSDIRGVGLKKTPGCSWIEVDNHLHTFTAGDHSHNELDEIYATIENLTSAIRKEGYIPQLQTVGINSGLVS